MQFLFTLFPVDYFFMFILSDYTALFINVLLHGVAGHSSCFSISLLFFKLILIYGAMGRKW